MTHATEWMAMRTENERLREENVKLREALREVCLQPCSAMLDVCRLCGMTWDGDERHEPGCLASKEGA